MTLTDQLRQLEEAMRAFPNEADVEVDVTLKINDDIPRGFVDEPTTVSSCYERYHKVLDAEGGVVRKIIRLSIPD